MAECPSVCEHLHLPLQSGSDRRSRACTAATRRTRYLERLRAAARRRSPISRSRPTSSSASPARPTTTSRETLEVVDEAAYDAAYTFVFSPRPGTAAAEMTDDFVPDEVRQGAHGAAHRRSSSATRSSATRPASVGSRRSSSRARRRRTRPCSPAAPARTSWCTSPPTPRRGTAGIRCGSPARRPTGCAARPRARAHPGPGGLTLHLALVGPTASGKSDARARDRPGARRRRDRLARLDAGLPGDGHRHRQADAGRAGRGARTT